MPGTVVVRLTSNRFADLARRLPEEVARICESAARAIETDAKTSMAEAKSGRVYTIGGVDHTASAPGEAPAVETGNLMNSIQTEQDGATRWVVYTNAEYAQHLEYGAPAAGIAPRPFFTPAAERERSRFISALEDLEGQLR